VNGAEAAAAAAATAAASRRRLRLWINMRERGIAG